MKKILIFLFLCLFSPVMPFTEKVPTYMANAQSFVQDFYKYLKGDTKLHPAKKKLMQKLTVGAIGAVGMATIGSMYVYFFKKEEQQYKRPISPSLSVYNLNVEKGFLLLDIRLKKVVKELKKALAKDDIDGTKQAIKKKVLYHSKAHELLWEAKSADAAYYIVVNYPGDKYTLLNHTKDDKTLLQCVIEENKNLLLAEALINLGANVNVSDEKSWITPLMNTARDKNIGLFVQLVAHGASLKAKDTKGHTAQNYVVISYGKKNKTAFLGEVASFEKQYPQAVSKIKKWAEGKKKSVGLKFHESVSNKDINDAITISQLKNESEVVGTVIEEGNTEENIAEKK